MRWRQYRNSMDTFAHEAAALNVVANKNANHPKKFINALRLQANAHWKLADGAHSLTISSKDK